MYNLTRSVYITLMVLKAVEDSGGRDSRTKHTEGEEGVLFPVSPKNHQQKTSRVASLERPNYLILVSESPKLDDFSGGKRCLLLFAQPLIIHYPYGFT